MPDEQVAAVLEKFRLEYDELTELRRRVDARLAQLHTAIAALTAADNREPLKFEGTLSDACRIVLRSATKPMAPTEVRDGVVGIGFQLSSLAHSNPMASVHAVLKRFVDAGDAESVPTKDGGTKYRWTGRAQTERAMGSLIGTIRLGDVAQGAVAGIQSLPGITRLDDIAKAAAAGIPAPSSIVSMMANIESMTSNPDFVAYQKAAQKAGEDLAALGGDVEASGREFAKILKGLK